MRKFTLLKKITRDIITAAAWALYILFVIIGGTSQLDAIMVIAFIVFIVAIVFTVYAIKANKAENQAKNEKQYSKPLYTPSNEKPLNNRYTSVENDNSFNTIEVTVKRDKGLSLLNLLDDYVVLDIETTGLNPNYDKIIEIGAVKVKGGEIVDTFSSLVNPKMKIDNFITELTGITNEMLATAPDIESVFQPFSEFIGNSIIVGHNVNFDINFVYESCIKIQNKPFSNDFVDTLRLSRMLFSNFENHKLCTLIDKFEIDVDQEHRALSDCIATYKCYEHMKKYVLENKNSVSKNIVIGIAPDCLPESHYPYAQQIVKALNNVGADTEYLRFSFDGERLDVNIYQKAFRVMIKKIGVYICGVGDCEEFKKLHPNVVIKELKNEYRIPISSPDDINMYANILLEWYNNTLDNIKQFSKYYPELHKKRFNNYIKDRQQYKIVS